MSWSGIYRSSIFLPGAVAQWPKTLLFSAPPEFSDGCLINFKKKKKKTTRSFTY